MTPPEENPTTILHDEHGDYCLLPITHGYVALVDAGDYTLVCGIKWIAHFDRHPDGTIRNIYARRSGKSGPRRCYLHRMILGISDPKCGVDHSDGNGLNCRHYNLRNATDRLNQGNAKLRCDNKSGYKGIYWVKSKHAWAAHIKVFGINRNLGFASDPAAAAKLYDDAAIEVFGDFARLNFPVPKKEPTLVPIA
jgi:hypothetical protein